MNVLLKKPFTKLHEVCSRLFRFVSLKLLVPNYYLHCKRKYRFDERRVLFLEVKYTFFSDNYKLIYDCLEKEKEWHLSVFFLNSIGLGRLQYLKKSLAMAKELASAKYVFINDGSNIFSAVPMRKETVVIQTWHACGAFKKWGFSTAEKIFGASRKELLRYPNYNNISYVTVSSPEVVWAYEEAMGIDRSKILPIGNSRTDIYYDKSFVMNALKKIRKLYPAAENKKIIFYAPTFRGRVATAQAPDALDIPLLFKALHDKYVLIIKHHPFVKERPVIEDKYKDFAIDMTKLAETEELICASDICITDYSSLVFEYSLMDKPIIFYCYDIEDYYDWRGFYYPFEEFVPGPIVKTSEELVQCVKNIQSYDLSRVKTFKERFMNSCDGHATERLRKLLEAN